MTAPDTFRGFSVPMVAGPCWPAPGPGTVVAEVRTRHGRELAAVLRPGSSLPPDFPVYRMYKGVCMAGDEGAMAGAGVRYDITVLAAAWPCPEPVKTAGHVHSRAGRSGLTFPELYQVIWGRAICVLQGEDAGVTLVDAGPGEVVWVPPGHGHVTVNPGPGSLATANLVAAQCRSVYEGLAARGGAAWYLVGGGGRGLIPVANPGYPDCPHPARTSAREWNARFAPGLPGSADGAACIYTWPGRYPAVVQALVDPATRW